MPLIPNLITAKPQATVHSQKTAPVFSMGAVIVICFRYRMLHREERFFYCP